MSNEKPVVEAPTGEPSPELVIEDLIVGDGPEAKAGDQVSAHYVGISHSTGKEFDASWNRGQPLDLKLGSGMVIEGWDKGLQGMKVGGRRRLSIPPHMGYGPRGVPGVIAPNETLIFVCDLVSAG
ncbi:FKBP-type peptidyl-prolyl cis-trans isomerase [Saccharopolyspora sp. TS4A08]|uniref:Peptidyl-prolyl cis-trans isomerase n=1 Tax=Saccharopolyspora ipomoeae TaxID=3042027 RepID=A0ABT6PH94_9PSEU|nr:FKBP-type peptidyl-prolyl cis-trans isomerase [Saccharopolyspora sp. TS4A08]MDI2027357.1 FKBP-type peptidyl-prolyl cis-trans isomerase [Saccharopolyspora sp. TS4A08]